jgi:cobalt/nickel transport protein
MRSSKPKKNIAFWLTGLGASLLVAGLMSPFASPNPDGLDRVSEDHGFSTKAQENPPSHRLPFYTVFDQYSLRGVPQSIATPLAGVIGTLVAFGLAWGVGKLLVQPGATPKGALGTSERPESDRVDRG